MDTPYLLGHSGSGRAVMAPRLLAAFDSRSERGGSAKVHGDCAGDGEEREKEVGAFSLGLSPVSAPRFSRMGGALDRAVRVGTKLLPTSRP